MRVLGTISQLAFQVHICLLSSISDLFKLRSLKLHLPFFSSTALALVLAGNSRVFRVRRLQLCSPYLPPVFNISNDLHRLTFLSQQTCFSGATCWRGGPDGLRGDVGSALGLQAAPRSDWLHLGACDENLLQLCRARETETLKTEARRRLYLSSPWTPWLCSSRATLLWGGRSRYPPARLGFSETGVRECARAHLLSQRLLSSSVAQLQALKPQLLLVFLSNLDYRHVTRETFWVFFVFCLDDVV